MTAVAAAAGAAAGAPAAGEWPPPNNRHVVTVALGFAAAVGTVAACVANSVSLSESSRDIATAAPKWSRTESNGTSSYESNYVSSSYALSYDRGRIESGPHQA